jgi:hypothetical protein
MLWTMVSGRCAPAFPKQIYPRQGNENMNLYPLWTDEVSHNGDSLPTHIPCENLQNCWSNTFILFKCSLIYMNRLQSSVAGVQNKLLGLCL